MLKFLADSLVLNKNKELNKAVGIEHDEEILPLCDNLFICIDLKEPIHIYGTNNANKVILKNTIQIIENTRQKMKEASKNVNIYIVF